MEEKGGEKKTESRCRRGGKALLQAWNPVPNVKDLFARSHKAVPQLDGLRLMACVWVIAFHVSFSVLKPAATAAGKNGLVAQTALINGMYNYWLFNIISAGDIAVDVFFVLSGFLIAYILYSEVDRFKPDRPLSGKDVVLCRPRACGGVKYWRFLSRRWLRLMPTFLIATLSTLVNQQEWETCKKWWWTNLLVVTNFAGPGTAVMGCIAQGWSIAVEAQFYVFSPLFVFLSTRRLMHRVKEGVFRGYWLYWALLLVSILIRVILLAVYDWDLDKNSDITYPDSTLHVFVASLEFYTKTYARFGPYVLGMLLAYYYRYNLRNKERSLVAAYPGMATQAWQQKGRTWRGCCRRCDGRHVFAGYVNVEEAGICPLHCFYRQVPDRSDMLGGLSLNEVQSPLLATEDVSKAEAKEMGGGKREEDVEVGRGKEAEAFETQGFGKHDLRRRCGSGVSLCLWASVSLVIIVFALFLTIIWPRFSIILSYYVRPAALGNLPLRRFIFLCGRSIFAGTVVGLILLCLVRLGTWVDAVMSWKPWVPLARLTYSAYLWQFLAMQPVINHVPAMILHLYPDLPTVSVVDGDRLNWIVFGVYIASFISTLLLDFVISFVVYLLVEKPFMNLRIG